MKKYIITAIALTNIATSCTQEFLDTASTKEVITNNVTSDASYLEKVVDGMHRMMYSPAKDHKYANVGTGQVRFGQASFMIGLDIAGEDMVFPGTTTPDAGTRFGSVYNWDFSINTTSQYTRHYFFYPYIFINNANMVINNADKTKGDATLINYALSQALAYRAFSYFNLVQLFGGRYVAGQNNIQLGVPIRLDDEIKDLPRATVEEVYTLINQDLDKALALAVANNLKAKYNKSHIDESVIRGFKARVALTQGRWAEAAAQAKLARAAYPLMDETQYKAGFNDSNNPEWMWGGKPNLDQIEGTGNFGWFWARNYAQSAFVSSMPLTMNPLLYAKFPATDVRIANVDKTGAHTALALPATMKKFAYTSQKFTVKDPSLTKAVMDYVYMRSSEMYLIEAEALARAGNEAESKAVFTELEKKRNATYVTSTKTGQAYIDDILLSRRLELWGEGFRFFDLKRLAAPLNRTGIGHNNTWILGIENLPTDDKRWQLKIPQSEIDTNPACVQNPNN
jgi:starch-binding outer membrane protein, SusD/RagB family